MYLGLVLVKFSLKRLLGVVDNKIVVCMFTEVTILGRGKIFWIVNFMNRCKNLFF